MELFLSIFQIAISVFLITTILLQQRSAGGSALFGGGGGAAYYQKRGFEKILYIATIVLSILFLVSSFINLLI